MIRDTGFNLIRIRIGQDSKLDEVAELLDIAHDQQLEVLFGFATFYVPYWFIEEYRPLAYGGPGRKIRRGRPT